MTTARYRAGPSPARPAETGLGRLAAWCYDRRRFVLGGWLLVVAAIVGARGGESAGQQLRPRLLAVRPSLTILIGLGAAAVARNSRAGE
jgi:hypothetical protein